ncbi:MAG: PilZ domain-containing protein [Candidatus Omnitrophica bacterium]|nr:PilZ domain-containing protein [Candidatus Omnitrophota bacterium]MBU2045060.1 PilZ domain-containing protein [Candidatus Omnitrophota bacterium]MBU2251460.1 PilZ domain-containing protein [Candidatus Omnitrophota bacterium]MBU2266342.1 PilZ domain-containing protein [Candidatus Omnitrophota bacterium]MBU2473203.1 PilZ domain-containing protein [Candidatus Omnitrophota bacterium]
MKANKRKHFRLKEQLSVFRCPVKYLFEHNALSQDISENGICLLAAYRMDIGEKVDLNIYLPESKEPIVAGAEVVRRNETNDPKYPYLMGLKFIRINQEARAEIVKHIKFYLLKQ